MSKLLRGKFLALGLAALLPALLLTAALGAATSGASLVSAKPPVRPCPTGGLHFSEEKEGVTYSVAVANLKAKGAECSTARRLATVVAKAILKETKVPARISGFNVAVKAPCAGCTPNSAVTAKSGTEVITFTVKGGA
jgi:hypothetical protein